MSDFEYDFNYNYDGDFHQDKPQKTKNLKGLAIASMVLGIVSLVLNSITILSILAGIVGLVFGIVSRKRGGGGFALAGIITSSAGIAMAVMIVVFGSLYGFLMEYFNINGNPPNSAPDPQLPGSNFALKQIADYLKNFIKF